MWSPSLSRSHSAALRLHLPTAWYDGSEKLSWRLASKVEICRSLGKRKCTFKATPAQMGHNFLWKSNAKWGYKKSWDDGCRLRSSLYPDGHCFHPFPFLQRHCGSYVWRREQRCHAGASGAWNRSHPPFVPSQQGKLGADTPPSPTVKKAYANSNFVR